MLVSLAKDEEDAENNFAAPVLETFPGIEAKYLDKVDNPIDLRTIRAERVKSYDCIVELQRDLLLMFENCCRFNGKRAKLTKYAL